MQDIMFVHVEESYEDSYSSSRRSDRRESKTIVQHSTTVISS
jgi:hypothetical protein